MNIRDQEDSQEIERLRYEVVNAYVATTYYATKAGSFGMAKYYLKEALAELEQTKESKQKQTSQESLQGYLERIEARMRGEIE